MHTRIDFRNGRPVIFGATVVSTPHGPIVVEAAIEPVMSTHFGAPFDAGQMVANWWDEFGRPLMDKIRTAVAKALHSPWSLLGVGGLVILFPGHAAVILSAWAGSWLGISLVPKRNEWDPKVAKQVPPPGQAITQPGG